jgi:hypothetical protein
VLFPLGFAIVTALTVAVGWRAQHDALLEHPAALEASAAPLGEKVW